MPLLAELFCCLLFGRALVFALGHLSPCFATLQFVSAVADIAAQIQGPSFFNVYFGFVHVHLVSSPLHPCHHRALVQQKSKHIVSLPSSLLGDQQLPRLHSEHLHANT